MYDAPSSGLPVVIDEADVPMQALLRPGHALAIITATEGPSYRTVGAAMAVDAAGVCTGSLSSGCIERDVARHAQRALETGLGVTLRYGRGSPFFDLKLPCGGGLEITVFPGIDGEAVGIALACLQRRETAPLRLSARGVAPVDLQILPEVQFAILGSGPEPVALARLVQAAGYPVCCAAPDDETAARLPGRVARLGKSWPPDLALDARTAVTLFFHDHDRETPLLRHALTSPVFYIGAQGSRRAAEARDSALLAAGASLDDLARLRRPFGAFPSARDPRSLAASVLADVLSCVPASGR
jgi:xanthine dehydrogenase accessory factor